MKEPLFDVIIFHATTLKIESIAGKGMRLDTGHHNAEKRLSTIMDRINDNYEVGIVPTGAYTKEGQKVDRKDLQ